MAYINGKQIMNVNVHITPVEITFKLYGAEYKAMYGMTWGEWCNTKYNTNGAYVANDGTVCDNTGFICYSKTNNPVLPNEQILSNG